VCATVVVDGSNEEEISAVPPRLESNASTRFGFPVRIADHHCASLSLSLSVMLILSTDFKKNELFVDPYKSSAFPSISNFHTFSSKIANIKKYKIRTNSSF
jgi:hypothetical protein